jgi:hypothetical protein
MRWTLAVQAEVGTIANSWSRKLSAKDGPKV